MKSFPHIEINSRFPFPHIWTSIAFLASSHALQPKQKPEADVCLSCLMKQSSVRWFNKPFLWLHISSSSEQNTFVSKRKHVSHCRRRLSFVCYSNALSENVCVQLLPVLKEHLLLINLSSLSFKLSLILTWRCFLFKVNEGRSMI